MKETYSLRVRLFFFPFVLFLNERHQYVVGVHISIRSPSTCLATH
jgi:hypothetical protein